MVPVKNLDIQLQINKGFDNITPIEKAVFGLIQSFCEKVVLA